MPALEWNAEESVEWNAATRLPVAAARFFDRAREVADSGALHELRLHIKRFRYALELFSECYGPGLRTRIEDLRMAQQLLGDLNDCTTVAAMLEPGESPEFRRYLTLREKRGIKAFRSLWKRTLGRPGEGKRWQGYLSRYARAPR